MTTSLDRLARAGLSFAFVFVAATKLMTPYQETFLLPPVVHFGVAISEIGVAVALWSRWRRGALLICVLGLAIAAVSASLVGRHDGMCGCVGSWSLSSRARLILIAACGGLATLSLWIGKKVEDRHGTGSVLQHQRLDHRQPLVDR